MFRRAVIKSAVGTCAVFTFFDVVGHPAMVVGEPYFFDFGVIDKDFYHEKSKSFSTKKREEIEFSLNF